MSSFAHLPLPVDPLGDVLGAAGDRNPHRKTFTFEALATNHPNGRKIDQRPKHGAQASRL